MSLTNPTNVVTEQDLKDFYDSILPYLGGSADAGFTPVGTIIPMIAETAPANYLICDGTAYNKVDYPELAAHLLSMTDHSMYEVSGDSTKFKVPDLRGEFLRGTGTNSHSNSGNGASVGVHQAPTLIPYVVTFAGTSFAKGRIQVNRDIDLNTSADSDQTVSNSDYNTARKSLVRTNDESTNNCMAKSSASTGNGRFAARPTNTAVLYCIAVKNIFINPTVADASNIAPIERNATSSRAYSRAGLKLIWNGVLYKTKTSIAIGDTFTIGTNIELSEDVETQIDASAKKNDLTNINIFGSTNNTGAKIDEGTFFYLNSALVRAKADIAANATLTLNTNYEAVTAGGLNKLQSDLATVKSSLNSHPDTDFAVLGTSGAASKIAYRIKNNQLELRSLSGTFDELAANMWQDIGTLPQAFIPYFRGTGQANYIYFPICTKSTVGVFGLMLIRQDGEIFAYASGTNIDSFWFQHLIPMT